MTVSLIQKHGVKSTKARILYIPLASDGSYDLEKQQEIAAGYKQIDEIKQGLINKIIQLTSINIVQETAEK